MKLTAVERQRINTALSDFTYTCGTNFAGLNLNGRLSEVCVRDVNCYDPLEKLYYSLNKDHIAFTVVVQAPFTLRRYG